MSLFISAFAKGRAQPWPTSREAGGIVRQVYKHVFDAAAVNTDIVEIGVLPARHRLLAMRVINPTPLTLTNAGILTGVAGAKTLPDGGARAMSAALAGSTPAITAAAAVGANPTKAEFDKTVVDLNTLAARIGFNVPSDLLITEAPAEYDRGVGVTLGGNAAVGNVLWMSLEYAQGI